jgi:gamma-glutamylcyclotransferase (GGCT)/AIG2-like uncharacterized protein YtfP
MSGLFAYGTLKTGELAFNQIEECIESTTNVHLSKFEIGIRDGLPVVFESANSFVRGELIIPKAAMADRFWEIVQEYEGSDLYRKADVVVTDEGGKAFNCQTFVAKREKARGYSNLENKEWSSRNDPYLAYSFPILLKSISQIKSDSYPADMYLEYWKYMNTLQERYLLLTVILEHIALLVIGTHDSTGPTARIKELGLTQEWKLAFETVRANPGITKIQVKDSKKLKYKYGNETAEEAINTYYQVRSNLSHQGKSGGYADCELMYTCLKDLSLIMSEYLKSKVIGIDKQWGKMGVDPL